MNKLTNGIISKCKNFSKTSYIKKFDAQFSKNSEKSNIFQIFLEQLPKASQIQFEMY